jgi:hypothetical protein
MLARKGSLPRDSHGNLIAGGVSDGRGDLIDQEVTVVGGVDVPLGVVGFVRWHGEKTPYRWRVAVEVEDGLAVVWTSPSHVQRGQWPPVRGESLVDADEVGDCPF